MLSSINCDIYSHRYITLLKIIRRLVNGQTIAESHYQMRRLSV